MKSTLSAAIASCALLFPMQHVFGEQEASSPATEQEVLQAIEKYSSAILNRDIAALEQIWADDYTFVNGAGECSPSRNAFKTLNLAQRRWSQSLEGPT